MRVHRAVARWDVPRGGGRCLADGAPRSGQLGSCCNWSSRVHRRSGSAVHRTARTGRHEVWPIIGGRFEGKGIRGTVIPGGGDFPVLRPDGVEVIDALYRLRTDDGVQIIIHNVGLTYPGAKPGQERYRLTPQFIAPVGKYDWLNRGIFISTLTDVPKGMELAKGSSQNDRLIQVYRVD
ncbi:MAG: DUF3237 family protein [Steroidobacteraceae bacterium]